MDHINSSSSSLSFSSSSSIKSNLIELNLNNLSSWHSDPIDSLSFALLWNGFSKSKRILSDGNRLENLTWRLWQREKVMLNHQQTGSHSSHSIIVSSSSSSSSSSPNPKRRQQQYHHHQPAASSSLLTLDSRSPQDGHLPIILPNTITSPILALLINSVLSFDLSSVFNVHPPFSNRTDNFSLENSCQKAPASFEPSLSILPQSSLLRPLQSSSSSPRLDSDTTPRSESPIGSFLSSLKEPPRIVNIAPTPPTASPAITAPTSPITHPSPLLQPNPEHLATLQTLLLSPHPSDLAEQPPLGSSSNFTTATTCFDQSMALQSTRPSINKRYSSTSDYASVSSLGFKSVATSPSIGGGDDQPSRLSNKDVLKKKSNQRPNRPKTTNSLGRVPRRATSTAGLKHKRRPPSIGPVASHSSSRSVSPRLTQPSLEDRCANWLDNENDNNDGANSDTLSSPSQQQRSECFLTTVPSLHSATQTQPSGDSEFNNTNPPTHTQESAILPEDDSLRTGQSPDDHSSCSLPSVISPIVPVTPNNSQVSAVFQVVDGTIPDSLSSSHTTGQSFGFFPAAPPPTPAENGAHLPTTMSAGLNKLKPAQKISKPPPMLPITVGGGGGGVAKKKAKFFIKESEVDDDKMTSPPSAPAQPVDAVLGTSTQTKSPSPQLAPSAPVPKSNARTDQQNTKATLRVEEKEERHDGTDSDEWGSEYSDDECEEDDGTAEKLRLEEQERKKLKQAEYHRELFAKKHFVQHNRSHDGSEEPPAPIRRAGLSMLFHPELNHLQHHPSSTQKTDSAPGGLVAPNRNYSAVELGRQASSLHKPPEAGPSLSSKTRGPRLSNSPIPRPCSLIKSKSSVAVPVLAGQVPPSMVQRSPSIHSAQSSLVQNIRRPSLGVGVSESHPPPPESGPCQPTLHRRHPSRLGGKPDNVEYSDDESDEDDEENNNGSRDCVTTRKNGKDLRMTEEQERRLGKLAQAHSRMDSMAISRPATRPEPIAAPLSPRTTRRNMLANEMTESVRRNLLWERQMRAQALGLNVGGLANDNGGGGELDGQSNPFAHALNFGQPEEPRHNLKNSKSGKGGSKSQTNLKEYRNFSKGFHRTGW